MSEQASPPPPRPLRATGHCRHYSWEGKPKCALGRDLSVPASSLKCMPAKMAPQDGPCGVREDYTEEERATWRDYVTEGMARVGRALAEIPLPEKGKKGGSGVVPCKACGTGQLHWARSTYNNHLRAQCTTPGCVAVMQ